MADIVPRSLVRVTDGTNDWNLAALTDNFANPTAPAVGAFGMFWDGATWDRMAGNSVDGVLVNLGANNDVTVTGAVDTELPAAAALSDAFANPTAPAVGAFLMGFDGVDWQRLRANASNELVVTTSGGPTVAKTDTLTSAALAVGASIDLNGTQVASTKTGKLMQVVAHSSVPVKIEVKTVLNGVATTRVVGFAEPAAPFDFTPVSKEFITQAESVTVGFDGFRVTITNKDDSQAADVYATILWDEV